MERVNVKKSFFFGFLSFLSAIGFLTSLYLAHHHYALSFGQTLSFQLCRGGCDAVNTSSYSELFGIPTASYGATVYFAIFILSSLGLLLKEAFLVLSLLSLTFFLSLFCLATSFVLFFISVFKLSSFCWLCGLTYLVNLFLVFFSGKGLRVSSGSVFKTIGATFGGIVKRRDPAQTLVYFIFFLTLASGMAASFFHSGKYRILSGERLQKFMESYANSPRIRVETLDSPRKGAKSPKATLVVFSDFTCSHCRNASLALERLLPEYQKELQIIYKHQVHDKTCNPYEEHVSPKHACQLAIASLCAQKNGKFWEYHDLLFASSETIQENELIPWAQKVGLDEKNFQLCMKDPQTQERLLKDLQEAHRLGVQSTPTFFLNGRRIQGLPPTSLFHTLLRHELQEKSLRQ